MESGAKSPRVIQTETDVRNSTEMSDYFVFLSTTMAINVLC